MWSAFFSFWFYEGLQSRDCMDLRRDFKLWTLKHCWGLEDSRNFWSWTKSILYYDIAASLWGQGVECGSLNAIGLHKLIRSGTIGRRGLVKSKYGLVGRSVPLWGWALRSRCSSHTQCLSWLPVSCTRYKTLHYLSYIMSACTNTCPAMRIMDWTSEL